MGKSRNQIAAENDQKLSKFIETFPNHLHHKIINGLWVFWRKDEEEELSQINLSAADVATNRMISDKIKSVFSSKGYKSFTWTRSVLQFWVPVTIEGARLVSTFGQPFAVSHVETNVAKYRLRSLKYQYNIDETTNSLDHPAINMSGAASGAFLSRFPERVTFTKQGSLPDRYAFEARLNTSYLLPICCPSQSNSCCVGVVEVSTDKIMPYNLSAVKSVVTALEEVGLSVFNGQQRIPYNNIDGLKPVKDEIENALKIVCDSHNIGLAQVWISCEDENHVPFSSSSLRKKRMLALKLTGYNVDEDSIAFKDSFEDYSYSCDMLPLRTGVELVEKTFQDYQPRFCKNISQVSDDTLMSYAYDNDTECSALVICLRSINTNNFDYVFEFIWAHNSNYLIFLVALLLTLKRCLPNFKLASGAELVDELHVIDVDNSTSETQIFKIFQGKRASTIPVTLEKENKKAIEDCIAHSEGKSNTAEIKLTQEVIEEQFGKTQKEAAKDLNVHESTLKRKCIDPNWARPYALKRKVNESYGDQSKTDEKDNEAIQDPMTVNKNEDALTIKAEYADDMIKFHLSISEATFKTIENKIGMKFNLSIGTYKLKYKDEDGDLILLKSDEDVCDCIKSSGNSDRTVVRLHVLPSLLSF